MEDDLCKHEDVEFLGMFSLVGSYHCVDCGYEITPVVLHYIRAHPHIMLRQVGPFTKWDEEKKTLNYLTEQYFEYYGKSLYQPPHWDHEPTKEEQEAEEKILVECEQHGWQAEVFADIICWILGREEKYLGSVPDEFTEAFAKGEL